MKYKIAEACHRHYFTRDTAQTCTSFALASFDRTSISAWLYKHPWITCQNDKPSIPMTRVACESKRRSGGCEAINASIPDPGIWVATGRAVVYYPQAAHAFSAGIKCRHCMCPVPLQLKPLLCDPSLPQQSMIYFFLWFRLNKNIVSWYSKCVDRAVAYVI